MVKEKLKYLVLFSIVAVFITIWCYFYFIFQFWTHLNPITFKSLVEYNGIHIKGYRGQQILVHQNFSHFLYKIENFAAKNRVNIIITQSYRLPAKKLTDTVVAPAVKSNHFAGHAVDFNITLKWKLYESKDLKKENFDSLPENIKNFIETIRSDEQLRWGGDFNTEDPIHIDDGLNLTFPGKWEASYHDCLKDYKAAEPKWHSLLNLCCTKKFCKNR